MAASRGRGLQPCGGHAPHPRPLADVTGALIRSTKGSRPVRGLVALAFLLPGCLALEPTGPGLPLPHSLPPWVEAEIRPGALPWDPLPCDPTRATTHGSDEWLAYRATMARSDGRHVANALGDPTNGDGEETTMNGPDTSIFGVPVTRWPTEAGALLVRDGRSVYLRDLAAEITPADVTDLADRAIAGLGLTVGQRVGDGTLEVVVAAPGHAASDAHGWLRVGQQAHGVDGDDEGSRVELDLRPWPIPGATWLSMEGAAVIAQSHLICWQESGGFSRGLERPAAQMGNQDFRHGELVWWFTDSLDWTDGRKIDCQREETWPHVVSAAVDARTGAVVAQDAWANGEGPCYWT